MYLYLKKQNAIFFLNFSFISFLFHGLDFTLNQTNKQIQNNKKLTTNQCNGRSKGQSVTERKAFIFIHNAVCDNANRCGGA